MFLGLRIVTFYVNSFHITYQWGISNSPDFEGCLRHCHTWSSYTKTLQLAILVIAENSRADQQRLSPTVGDINSIACSLEYTQTAIYLVQLHFDSRTNPLTLTQKFHKLKICHYSTEIKLMGIMLNFNSDSLNMCQFDNDKTDEHLKKN